MFINFSNHPSGKWPDRQIEYTVKNYGEIVDVAFPNVPVEATEQDIQALADDSILKMKDYLVDPSTTVMCQGEFTLSYAVIRKLIEKNYCVVAAITTRNTKEEVINGKVTKVSEFVFCGYREYR